MLTVTIIEYDKSINWSGPFMLYKRNLISYGNLVIIWMQAHIVTALCDCGLNGILVTKTHPLNTPCKETTKTISEFNG